MSILGYTWHGWCTVGQWPTSGNVVRFRSSWNYGLGQQGVWVPFWTPKPLKRTPQDTQFFVCGISKNLNLKFIKKFTTANFRHPVSKSWLRNCMKYKLKSKTIEARLQITKCHIIDYLGLESRDSKVWIELIEVLAISLESIHYFSLIYTDYAKFLLDEPKCLC